MSHLQLFSVVVVIIVHDLYSDIENALHDLKKKTNHSMKLSHEKLEV